MDTNFRQFPVTFIPARPGETPAPRELSQPSTPSMNKLQPKAPKICEINLGECRATLLPLLSELSRITAESGDLSDILHVLLRLMQRHMKVVRGMVCLYDPGSGNITVHESVGLTEEEAAKGVYHLGEGITGKVVESGKAIVVPCIAEEPDFLNRTGSFGGDAEADSKLSFICVPILRGKKVMGTISAERLYDNSQLFALDVEILSVLATVTAQAVELYMVENYYAARLADENQRLRSVLKERFRPTNIIGNSKPMVDVYRLIEKVNKSKTTVLVLGESGVGKELVASAIHYNGPNASGPFVKFNCASLPENIIESELFGHEKGSFTGATAMRRGRFEEADGGTIFIDELGEMSLSMQAKLLRVLQERTFERVGGNKPIKVDLRIVAATNRDLTDMVSRGTFREDLYYRLNVFPITIPPLRERGNDITALADYFVAKFSREMGIPVERISTPAINMLLCYHWPGNVRELENVIERAMLLAEDGVIHGYNLPASLQLPVVSDAVGADAGSLDAKLAAVEYEMIVDTLKATHGSMTLAGEQLGLTRRILGLRMEKYKLSYKDFR